MRIFAAKGNLHAVLLFEWQVSFFRPLFFRITIALYLIRRRKKVKVCFFEGHLLF